MEAEKRKLAVWMVGRRLEIEGWMNQRLGPAAPAAGDPSAEALRRFRTFAAAALLRGSAPPPALEGLRVNERRVVALLEAWIDAAEDLAGDGHPALRATLVPLVNEFRLALRATRSSRRAGGAPRAQRRAVSAAIDRVADAFFAIDTDNAQIVDANPAAGALLRVQRDALLGVDAMSFVPEEGRQSWWNELDAVAESDEARAFRGRLQDASGVSIPVEASATRFQSKGRTLALVVARPNADAPRVTAAAGALSPVRAPA